MVSSHFRSLLNRTFRSYTRKERLFSAVLVCFIFVLFLTFIPAWTGRALASGVYSEGFVGQFKRLNPLFVAYNEVDQDVSRLIFSGLTKYDPATQSFVADLADYTVSTDGLTYTFTIHDDVTWHDGISFTADDVFFTYHDLIQSSLFTNPVLQQNFMGVTITEVDPKTVTFTLQEANSFFIANTTVGIVPKHLLADIPVDQLSQDAFNQAPVGTGPFMMSGSIHYGGSDTSDVVLKSYDGYYGTKPQITSVHFFAFPDYKTLVDSEGFLRGVGKINSLYQSDFSSTDRFQFLQYTLPQYTALFLNTDRPILQRKQVRLALLKAIDKKAIVDALGNGQVIDTPLLQLDQNAWLHQPNVTEAQGALYDSGWHYDSADSEETLKVRKNSDGTALALTLLVRDYPDNPAREQESQIVIAAVTKAWNAIGVQVDVVTADSDTFASKVATRDYDVLFTGQSLGYNLDTYAYWHSSQSASPTAVEGETASGLNFSNYRNADADFLIESIRKVPQGGEAQRVLLEELAKTIDGDVPAVFLYTSSYTFVLDQHISGVFLEHMAVAADRFASITSWMIQ